MLKNKLNKCFIFIFIISCNTQFISANSDDVLYSYNPFSVTNLIELAYETFRIHQINNTDDYQIYTAATFGKVVNGLHILNVPSQAIKALKNSVIAKAAQEESNGISDLIQSSALTKYSELFYSLLSIDFFKNDFTISNNCKEIAKYNNLNQNKLSNDKKIQYSWLAFNKLSPILLSLGITAHLILQENNSNNDLNLLSLISYYVAFANLSEVARKHCFYNIELKKIK